jgi:hypothetical protein
MLQGSAGVQATPSYQGTLNDALGAAVSLMRSAKETEANLRAVRATLTGETVAEDKSDQSLPSGTITQLHVVLQTAAVAMENAAHHSRMIQLACGAGR